MSPAVAKPTATCSNYYQRYVSGRRGHVTQVRQLIPTLLLLLLLLMMTMTTMMMYDKPNKSVLSLAPRLSV